MIFGGSHVAVGLVDEKGKIISRRERVFDEEDRINIEKRVIAYITRFLYELLEEFSMEIKEIEVIGIASPGTIRDGIIENVVNLGIDKLDIAKPLSKQFPNIPIKVKNDAKCAAIAEKIYGNLKPYADSIFLCLGTGIGGAAFLNHQLLEPKTNAGMEFGHMVIKEDGISCNCGNKGCFEKYGGMKVFRENVKKVLYVEGYPSNTELKEMILRNRNQPEIVQVIENYLGDLAIGIGNLINIFEPEAICIGGSFASLAEILLEPLKKKIIEENILYNKRESLNIQVAKLENDAGIVGSANL